VTPVCRRLLCCARTALLNELRGPLTGVAATLSKSKGNAAGATATAFESDDLKKVRRRTHAHRTPAPRSLTR